MVLMLEEVTYFFIYYVCTVFLAFLVFHIEFPKWNRGIISIGVGSVLCVLWICLGQDVSTIFACVACAVSIFLSYAKWLIHELFFSILVTDFVQVLVMDLVVVIFNILPTSIEENFKINVITFIPFLFSLCIISIFSAKYNKLKNIMGNNRRSLIFLNIGIFALGLLISIINNQLLEEVKSHLVGVVAFIIFLCGSVIFMSVFASVYFFNISGNLRFEMEMREYMLNQQKNYYMSLLEQEEKTKKFRHDIRAHLSCIAEYVEKEEYADLRSYMEEIYVKYEESGSVVYSGNHIIDAVVADIENRFPHVLINWRGKICNELQVKMIDLCIIISNLLINACREVENTDYPSVNVSIKVLEPSLVMQFENYTPNNVIIENGSVVKKEYKYGHGYGLKNVKESVDKYGGMLEIDNSNNRFKVSVMIPNAIQITD